MNVIRHNHIATNCDVEVVLGAFGKKNERSVDLILCQEPLSFVRAERDEINRTCCVDPSQARRSPFECPLHRKSYSTLNKTVFAVATALWPLFNRLWDRPQAGGYKEKLSVRSLARAARRVS